MLSIIASHSTIMNALPTVTADLAFLAHTEAAPQTRIYPPSSGIATVRPPQERHSVTIGDARKMANAPTLDEQGFALHSVPTAFKDFYDDDAVRSRYYPEVRTALRDLMGALEVIVFDHNVRSAARAARGELGVRVPVDQAHNDYTERSGPKRKLEILEQAGRLDLKDHRVAFVNLWRPIVGPVWDNPLAVCDARTVQQEDLVATEIMHFGEDNLEVPRHRGEIYSLRFNPAQRWFYFSEMQPSEALLLKNFDSRRDIRARYMPHTGFLNPLCPEQFTPRESIEARTLVVFGEAG
jgi:hypothetical protein